MDQHVVALFYEPRDAAHALEALVAAGIEPGEISLFATETGAEDCRDELDGDFKARASNGRANGGALALGGTRIAAGTGGGAVVAAGPLLMVAMAAYGFGSTIGGIVAALTRVGLPEPIATHLDTEVCDSGAALVGVATLRHDDGRIGALLRRHGATSVMATAAPVYVS
jgi:hypothetical protein